MIARRLATLPLRLLALIEPVSMVRGAIDALRSIRRNFPLALTLTRRDLTSRHAGQLLGVLWAVGQPLFLMMLFVFVFGVVFSQRIGGTVELPRDYTIYILSGLVPWLSFTPALMGTCQSITGNGHLIKQVTVDPELFPLKDVLGTFVFWVVGVIVITTYTLFQERSVPWTFILLPIAVAIQFATALGVGWLLSSLSVFVRDIREVVQMLVTAGIYVLPIVYLPQWVPAIFQPILYLNPFSYMIWVYQDVFYFGRIEHPYAWIIASGIAILSMIFGHRIFRHLRPYFATYL